MHSETSHKAANKPTLDLKKAAASAFAAFTIGSGVLASPTISNAVDTQPFAFTSTNIVSEKVISEPLAPRGIFDVFTNFGELKPTYCEPKRTWCELDQT